MDNKGWIIIYRQIEENALWTSDEPFDRRSAWIDLLLLANHEDREIIVNGCPLTIHRGQKFTSIRKLSQKWKWSRDKVVRYIKLLEKSGMLLSNRTHNGTLLTIVNYGNFQDDKATKKATGKATGKATVMTRTGRGQGTNKQLNNDNNDNNETNNKAAPPFLDPDGNKLQ